MRQVTYKPRQLSFASWVKAIVGSLFAMYFFTACAFGVDHVKLYNPLEYNHSKDEAVKEAHAAISEKNNINSKKIKITIDKIEDNRNDSSCIGAKRNSWGMITEKVDVEEGVVFLNLFKQHLIDAFQKAGYEIISVKASSLIPSDNKDDVKAIVDAEVNFFYVDSRERLFPPFTGDVLSAVSFGVRLRDIGNREILDEIFSGTGNVIAAFLRTKGLYEESINIAYAEAMKNFYMTFSDDKLKRVFDK